MVAQSYNKYLKVMDYNFYGQDQFVIHNLVLYEKLDHIPSSYIVLMVHVVKGRQYTHRCRGLNRRDGV